MIRENCVIKKILNARWFLERKGGGRRPRPRRIKDSSKKLGTRHPSIARDARDAQSAGSRRRNGSSLPSLSSASKKEFRGTVVRACHIPVRSLHNVHNSRIPTAASSSSQLFRRFRGAATAHEVHGRETLVQGQKALKKSHFRDLSIWHRARASRLLASLIGRFRT